MRNFFGSPIKKLRTAAEVEDYITEEEGSALAFFERGDTELKAMYSAAAAELRSLKGKGPPTEPRVVCASKKLLTESG